MSIVRLPIASIKLDGNTQTRAQIDSNVITEYAEAIKAGTELPVIEVFYDGTHHYLADGFHRLKANETLGFVEIDANVYQGDRTAAVWYALGANQTHGLRRTNADKRRAVEIALREFPSRSDNGIAERCGVSPTTVGGVRSVMYPSIQNGKIDREVTRNGVTYTQSTANIGRKPTRIDRQEYADDDYQDDVPVRQVEEEIDPLDRSLGTPSGVTMRQALSLGRQVGPAIEQYATESEIRTSRELSIKGDLLAFERTVSSLSTWEPDEAHQLFSDYQWGQLQDIDARWSKWMAALRTMRTTGLRRVK